MGDRAAATEAIRIPLMFERRRRGLTQQQLAKQIGLGADSNISRWERGLKDLRLSSLMTWAAALGYQVTLTRTAFAEPSGEVSDASPQPA